MKPITFLSIITSLALLSQGYCEEPPFQETSMADLEKELLALEDELLSSEDPFLEGALPTLTEVAPPVEEAEKVQFSEVQEEESQDGLVSFLAKEALTPSAPEEFLEQDLSPVLKEPSSLDTGIQISLRQVFSGSPFIYSLLLSMSLASIAICLYASLRIKQQTQTTSLAEIRANLIEKKFLETTSVCQKSSTLLSRMVSGGLAARDKGLPIILENMKSEGKRATLSAWQQLGILQDIAIIAPMLGLLGTVIGLFYAFYDLNRSFDSIKNLLDGLGISVGTTVAGIGVAILAMILHSATKFRLVRSLAKVEVEASALARLMDEKN